MNKQTIVSREKPRYISEFRFLKVGSLSPSGFSLYHITEINAEFTVRNLREVEEGRYVDTSSNEFRQAL